MDNVTHTLIGVLVGEASATYTSRTQAGLSAPQRRNLLVTIMGVGSNLPDLDFLYSTVTGSKLDYLLHHRGHTHTVAGMIAIAALLGLAGEWWIRRLAARPATRDRVSLWMLCLLAPTLHIAMDAANNYGVHPWWPFDSRWIYGDSIFIIEPLFWAACAPLVFLLRTPVARWSVALVLIAGAGLTFLTGMVPIALAFAYVALALALSIAGWRLSKRTALAAGISLWLSVTALFSATSQHLRERVAHIAAEDFPTAVTLDVVLTPMPVNPFCWEVLFVQREADSVVLRRAMMSASPAVIAADQCPSRGMDVQITAPLQEIAAPSTPEMQWRGEVISRISQLRRVWRDRCQAEAMMRFARAPWLARIDQAWVLGDLRFDRESELGFAEIPVDPPEEPCPALVPSWTPPRTDLLGK